MNRRTMLKLVGGSVGATLGAGYVLLPPSASSRRAPPDGLAVRLFESFDDETRKRACVAYDHPLRQYYNRGVRGAGLPIDPRTLDRRQRQLVVDLLAAGLSDEGRDRLTEQYFIRWPGVHVMNLLVCGDPRTPPYQLVLSGPHLNLRLGGASREGAAFGGPLIYGDQRGDGRAGLPGNVYRYQLLMAQRLFESLDGEQRRRAVLPTAPVQTQIDTQGAAGTYAGAPIATLGGPSRTLARELVEGILATYAEDDVRYAWRCIEANGGVEAMYLSYYEDGRVDGAYQIFRLEGPGAVFYFRGHPHVHAFINVAMHPESPLSVGALLGDNPRRREGLDVKALFEDALRFATKIDRAYYDAEDVAGRLRAGSIRHGDIYALESWGHRIVVGEVGGEMIATTDHVADELAATRLGGPLLARRDGPMLRDATVAYLEAHGFGGG